MIRQIIFDLDDTLIRCGEYYVAAKSQWATFQQMRYPHLTHADLLHMIAEHDLASVKTTQCFSAERFPQSFYDCSLHLDAKHGHTPQHESALVARNLGAAVFDADYAIFPATHHVLRRMRHHAERLTLITKGQHDIQWKKIDKHHLTGYFDDIHVVPRKTVPTYFQILHDSPITFPQMMMVGDSMKDDIVPTKTLGIRTVHIQKDMVWGYDDAHTTPDHQIMNIESLPEILGL